MPVIIPDHHHHQHGSRGRAGSGLLIACSRPGLRRKLQRVCTKNIRWNSAKYSIDGIFDGILFGVSWRSVHYQTIDQCLLAWWPTSAWRRSMNRKTCLCSFSSSLKSMTWFPWAYNLCAGKKQIALSAFPSLHEAEDSVSLVHSLDIIIIMMINDGDTLLRSVIRSCRWHTRTIPFR